MVKNSKRAFPLSGLVHSPSLIHQHRAPLDWWMIYRSVWYIEASFHPHNCAWTALLTVTNGQDRVMLCAVQCWKLDWYKKQVKSLSNLQEWDRTWYVAAGFGPYNLGNLDGCGHRHWDWTDRASASLVPISGPRILFTCVENRKAGQVHTT